MIYKILICFYLIIAFCIFIVGAGFIRCKKLSHIKIQNLYLDEIKTGDTFMISYQNKYRILSDSLIGLNFTHSSTAYWEDGKLYFIEYAYYNEKWNGIMKIPFQIWINFNKNTIILINKLKIINHEKEERKKLGMNIEKFYQEFKRKDDLEPNFSLNWNRFRQDSNNPKNVMSRFINLLVGIPENKYERIDPDKNKLLTCVEITACLLCETGIVKKDKSISYMPSKFVGMKGFSLNNNYNYDEHYICDISNFKNL